MNTLKKIVIIAILAFSIVITANSYADNTINNAQKSYQKADYKSAIIQLKNHIIEHPKDPRARLWLAKSYLKVNDIKAADKEITRAYKLTPFSDEIVLTYAQVLIQQSNFNKVHEILGNELSIAENENQRLIYKANAFLGQNQLADAKQILSDLANRSDNVQVFIGLAKVALAEKEMAEAAQWLEKTLALEPENEDALQTLATSHIANKNYSEALIIYNNLLQKQENSLPLYLQRATIKYQLNNPRGAEKDIKKVLGRVKNHPQANYMLAQIKLHEQNYKESLRAAQNVLNLIPDHFNSMMILGISHYSLGNYNQANRVLTRYLAAKPDNITVQNILANVYLEQQKGEQAVLILERIAEEKRNNNARILITLGSAYVLTGEHQKSLAVLTRAKQLEPDNELIQKKLFEGQLRAGDLDSAINGLEKLVDSEQASQNTHYMLIVSYIKKGELQKAEEQLSELLTKFPDDPALYNLTAEVEKHKGNRQKARDAYHQAIQRNNNSISAYMGLAELATLEKDPISAKAYYTKITQINPKYVKAYLFLASIAEQQNQQQEIEHYLKTGLQQAEGDIKSQVIAAGALSQWYIKQKTPEKIMPIARELNQEYPNDYTALSFLAAAQISNKKNAQAEQTLKKIISKNHADVKHRLLLAKLLKNKRGEETEYLELLDSLIIIIPNNPKPVVFKAEYLLGNKLYQQAIELANYAEKQFPTLALGAQIKGDSYRLENNLEKALEHYQDAYRIQASNNILFIISDLLVKQGKGPESMEMLKAELQNTDKDLEIHFKIAGLYQKNKQYEMASKHYLKMLAIKTDSVSALNNLAWIYAQEKNPQALSVARKAYKKAPESAAIIDTYGYLHLKQGELSKGVKLLEYAVNRAPENYDIKYHLAEGYHLQGEKKKARALLRSLVNLNVNIEFSEKENAQALFNQLQ